MHGAWHKAVFDGSNRTVQGFGRRAREPRTGRPAPEAAPIVSRGTTIPSGYCTPPPGTPTPAPVSISTRSLSSACNTVRISRATMRVCLGEPPVMATGLRPTSSYRPAARHSHSRKSAWGVQGYVHAQTKPAGPRVARAMRSAPNPSAAAPYQAQSGQAKRQDAHGRRLWHNQRPLQPGDGHIGKVGEQTIHTQPEELVVLR